jgi:hypothetical protein
MKAQSLWAGNDYAYLEYRGRGVTYSYNVERIRIVRVVEEKHEWNKNTTSYALVKFLDYDGNPIPDKDEGRVRARDIVDFWDDWWNDVSLDDVSNGERLLKQKAYAEEQEKIREQQRLEWKKKQEEREAEEAEKRAQIQIKRNKIRQKLESAGLDVDSNSVIIPYNAIYLTIQDPELTRWIEEGAKVIDI